MRRILRGFETIFKQSPLPSQRYIPGYSFVRSIASTRKTNSLSGFHLSAPYSFADFTFSASANRARFVYVLIRAFAISQNPIHVSLEAVPTLRTQGVNLVLIFLFLVFFHEQNPSFLSKHHPHATTTANLLDHAATQWLAVTAVIYTNSQICSDFHKPLDGEQIHRTKAYSHFLQKDFHIYLRHWSRSEVSLLAV
jgi:hypothetical protein